MKKILPSDALLLPGNAERVFSGVLFDVYQWSQTMFDGSTKTFEMLKRADTVQVLVIKDNTIVLVNNEQPGRPVRMHLPGGRVDDTDESWLHAAKRELREETGIECKHWRLIDVQQPIPKIEWFVPFYLATDIVSIGAQEVEADGEKIEVLHRDYDSLRTQVLSGSEPTLQYAIPLFLKYITLSDLLKATEYSGRETDR